MGLSYQFSTAVIKFKLLLGLAVLPLMGLDIPIAHGAPIGQAAEAETETAAASEFFPPLTFAVGAELFIRAGGQETTLDNPTADPTTTYQVLSWSPEGQLAVVQDYFTVVLLSEPDRATRIFTSDCSRPPTLTLDWGNQGRQLVIQERCEVPLDETAPLTQAIYLYRLDTAGPIRPLASLPEEIASEISISPDAAFVAYVQDQHIYRLPIAGGEPEQLTAAEGEYALAGSPLAWSPDGEQIAFFEGTYPFQRLNVMNADGSERRTLTPQSNFQIYRSRLYWSPDSRSLAFFQPYNAPFSNQEVIQLVNVATGDITTVTAAGFYDAVAWSEDSQQLIFASGDPFAGQYLFLWDRLSEEFTRLTESPVAQVLHPLWPADSNRLLFTALPPGDELANRQLYGFNLQSQTLEALTDPEDYVFPVVLGGADYPGVADSPVP